MFPKDISSLKNVLIQAEAAVSEIRDPRLKIVAYVNIIRPHIPGPEREIRKSIRYGDYFFNSYADFEAAL